MIVDPDFPDHWKTRLLIDLLSDPAAPMYVIRLWAHCQNRRTHQFEDLTPFALKAICHFEGDPDKFEAAMTSSGFVRRVGSDITVHEWEEYNASLIANWSNGKKGGRPKKPIKNPSITHGIPMANPDETHGEPKTNPSITDKIGLDKIPPPSPPRDVKADPNSVWAAAEAELSNAGVGKSMAVCDVARSRGCQPAEVRAVLTFWQSQKPAWEVGALVRRLENLHPGQDPAMLELWPPTSKAAEVAKSREGSLRKQEDLERKKSEAMARLTADQKRIQDLEDSYGEYLDGMTPKQIRKFATNVCKDAVFLLKSYRPEEGVRGILRESLLQDMGQANFEIPMESAPC